MKTYRNLIDKYKKVDELPTKAMTVSNYCKIRGCTIPYIYQLIRTNKADFEIIVFKGINFILPNEA